MTAVVYSTIVILSLYLALVAQGFVIALAFIVGGIAFFALQCHFHKYYNDLVTNDEMDGNSDSDDHDDHLRLPPV